MGVVLLFIRLILFAVFALAGVGKLLDLKGSEKAVKEFGTPEEFAKFFAIGLPFAEIVFAVCLLFTETAWIGAVGALLLLVSFIGAMVWHLGQGTAPDCHCFGAFKSEPVSKKSLIRNVIFAVLAFVLILSGKNNQGASLFDFAYDSEAHSMPLILGLATVGLLAAAVFYLKKISEQQTQILRRIDVLEITALDGNREVVREELNHSSDGLPVGSPAPDFILPDTNGRNVSMENLLLRAKPILFFFVSPACNPCAALLPEIEIWQNEFKGKLDFIFVSNGTAKENLDKFASETAKEILLQNDREVAAAFGAQWTPTAILMNRDGTIASRAAIGDKAIRKLVEQIKMRIGDAETLLIANDKQASKIGKYLPEFSRTDVSGKNISSEDLRGKKTLVAFWNLSCGFCERMLEELRDWDRTKGADEPNLLLLSEGNADAHRNLNLQSPVVLDADRKISKELGMSGTPSAVMIGEDGKIVSETAEGAENIWALIGKRK